MTNPGEKEFRLFLAWHYRLECIRKLETFEEGFGANHFELEIGLFVCTVDEVGNVGSAGFTLWHLEEMLLD